MTRIEITDTIKDVILKMAGGNPGAIRVCMEIIGDDGKTDPDAVMGYLSNLLDLDTLAIYEHRIWMLYKGVCGEHIGTMIGILRAWQLGFITEEQLNHAIDNRGDGIDIEEMINKVKERLPNFRPMPPIVTIMEKT